MKGFTLIEILVVIGIISILMAAVLVAINPFRQFAQANNASRWSGVTTLMNAIYQNVIDNKGEFDFTGCPESSFPTTAEPIRNDDADPLTDESDICGCIIPTYVATVPYDPQYGHYTSCTDYDTGDPTVAPDPAYTIVRDATTARITICAPAAQLGETICITR